MSDVTQAEGDERKDDSNEKADREHAALFWAAFARGGGGMLFARECVDAAVRLNCYDWARKNRAKFKQGGEKDADPEDQQFLRNTVACCVRAGRIAAGLAARDGREEINEADFEEAYSVVKVRVTNMVREGGGEPVKFFGGLCSGA